MRGKVDDHHFPARLQQAPHLRQHAARIVEVVQHLVHDNDVCRSRRQVDIADIAQAHLRMVDAGTGQARPRHGEHFAARIDADAALVAVGQHFQHAPGAGAQVDQRINAPFAHCLDDSGFHCLFRHMQRLEQVPAAGNLGEILAGLRLLAGPRRLLPLAVAAALDIVLVDPADQPLHQRCRIAIGRQSVIGPGALGIALDQAGIGQKLQMPRDAGLALLEDFCQVLDRMLAFGKQGQQAQSGPLTRRLQHRHQFFELRHRPLTRYKDVFISRLKRGLEGDCNLTAAKVKIPAHAGIFVRQHALR